MQVIRWQEKEPADEGLLHERLRREGLSPYSWSNGPGDYYAVHSHAYEKVLYCVRGSIRFLFPDHARLEDTPEYLDLAPGDGMILPPGVRHSAQVGDAGVTCLEAARRV